ncbi:MAG: histidinol dehydrogenase [Chloroflexi bacterium]|nr:MAG: histidinol dehydrogenase [Chloroflexota bacterium]
MLTICTDVAEARRTVLNRAAAGSAYPAELLQRIAELFGAALTPAAAVARVLQDVSRDGDDAAAEWSRRLDGVAADPLAVPAAELAAAASRLPAALNTALQLAAQRIRTFHENQQPRSWSSAALGGQLGQRVVALRRVGIYVPGGSAPLASSLLMAALPARVAGVEEIVVCTPPAPAGQGVADAILAAAQLAGVQHVFQLGGAQAIAAMAYGTQSIARVDKIVGPGGLFVTLAKQQLYGTVGLDGLAGPTETIVVADAAANPEWVAADMLAQAEHDVLATAILLTDSAALAAQVQAALQRRMQVLPRKEVIAQSLAQRGGIVVTPDVATAVALADEFAPEHLCLCVANASAWAARVRNAGGIFIGERSFEVLGDYVAGPSHIMPTGGSARFASPCNVLDFVRIMSIIELDAQTAASLAPAAALLAQAEQLEAHAAAALCRSHGAIP